MYDRVVGHAHPAHFPPEACDAIRTTPSFLLLITWFVVVNRGDDMREASRKRVMSARGGYSPEKDDIRLACARVLQREMEGVILGETAIHWLGNFLGGVTVVSSYPLGACPRLCASFFGLEWLPVCFGLIRLFVEAGTRCFLLTVIFLQQNFSISNKFQPRSDPQKRRSSGD